VVEWDPVAAADGIEVRVDDVATDDEVWDEFWPPEETTVTVPPESTELGQEYGVAVSAIRRSEAGRLDLRKDLTTSLGFTVGEPPTVTSFAINNGAASTTNPTVALNNTCSGSPTHYMASEKADLAGAAWLAYSAAPGFTLSAGGGTKTVYFKAKNAVGESGALPDSIEYTVPTVYPAVPTQCPAVVTLCPLVATGCPPTTTKCPALTTKCPASTTKCPPITTLCPPSTTKCPPVTTKCPTSATKCPPVTTLCPPSTTKCPAAATTCPPTTTKCPPVTTKCPPVATKCPPVTTNCPPITTLCPPVATKCPPVTTVCPPTTTKCPATATLCPPVTTKCPPVTTKCPACP